MLTLTEVNATMAVAPAGEVGWQVGPADPTPDSGSYRLTSLDVSIPEPVGATTGSHRVEIGVLVGGGSRVVVAAVEAPFGDQIEVRGAGAADAALAVEGSFPGSELALLTALRGLEFDAESPIDVHYVNGTDAQQTGQAAISLLAAEVLA